MFQMLTPIKLKRESVKGQVHHKILRTAYSKHFRRPNDRFSGKWSNMA